MISKQAALQQIENFEHALRQRLGPVGMRFGQAFDACHKLIHPRVVLHGARAQRIHTKINGVVPRRQPREVPDEFDLAQLGKQPRRVAMRRTKKPLGIDRRDVKRRHFVSPLPGRRLLKQECLVLRGVRANFAQRVRARIFTAKCHRLYLDALSNRMSPG